MRTTPQLPFESTQTPHFSRRLTLLVLILLAISGGWQSPLPLAQEQTPEARFTESLKFQEIEPGIEYGQTTAGHVSNDEHTGPWFINVLRIDPTRAELTVVHALDEGVGLETVMSLATRHGAVAGTNGGYFTVNGPYRGECLGLLLLNGKLISEPHYDREALGLNNTGNVTDLVFGHLRFSGQVSANSQRREAQGLNRAVDADELVVFTPEFHRTTLTSPDVIEAIVRKGRVVAIRDLKGSSEIPVDGYVVSARGNSRDWMREHIKRGSQVTFTWRLNSIEAGEERKWQGVRTILGAGPQLIKEGKIAITNTQEGITAAFVDEGHPRTAIAKLASGKLLLVTVDGRQPSESIGMSLPVLAKLLLELGAVEAMNLDGGGSTTMVVRDKLVNKPSDQDGERPVSDAILVFPRRK